MTYELTQRRSSRIQVATSACVLLGVFVLGGIARVWELGKRSLWYDELFCVVGAATSRSLEELSRNWMAVDGHPPGYMMFLYTWFKLVPATEVWARVPSTAISLALLLYLVANTSLRVAKSVRLYAAALYSVSSIAIYYAQTGRQYGILMACGIGALLELGAILSPDVPKRGPWIRLLAWLLVAAYVHYLVLLTVAAIFAVALVQAYGRRRDITSTLLAASLFGVLYVPGFITLIEEIRLRVAGWQANEPIIRLGRELIVQSSFGAGVLVTSFGLAVFAIVVVTHRRQLGSVLLALFSDRYFRVVFAVLVLTTAQLIALSFVAPFLQLRYALVLYAPLLLSVAAVLAALAPLESWAGTAVVLSVFVLGVAGYGEYRQTHKQDWRRSAEYVAEHAHPEDEIFVLGADPSRAALDYLRARDVDGYFYSRNIPFYTYYFERLDQPQLGRRLVNLPIEPRAQRDALDASHASTLFVLAPHHTKLAPEGLQAHGFRVDEVRMFSTRVYRLDRPGAGTR